MTSISSQDLKNILKEVWNSPSIIIKTPDYIYSLKKEENEWIEISYMIAEKELQKRNLSDKQAILYLIEELTKSLVQYSPQFQENIIIEKTKLDEILDSI